MAYQVYLFQTEQSFEVESDETVLDAALRANVSLAHDCRLGGCGTCRIKLLEGTVSYEDYPFGITPEEESEGFALACQARPQSDLIIAPARQTVALPEPQRHVAVVKDLRPLSSSVFHLVLQIHRPEPLRFVPGQYMNVYLPDGQARSFSMASLPNGGEIDFHIRKVPGGRFTDLQLGQLKAGDRLDVELPLGAFHYRKEDDRPLLMVATGTGLAPIKSILESLMDDDDAPPIRLYWGAYTEADLYLHDEIERWKDRLCDFQYIPVLSDPGNSWTGRRGFVQHAVAEDMADLSEYAVYMCGSPNMIRDAKSVFLTLGASVDQIYSDSFNLAHQIASAPVAV